MIRREKVNTDDEHLLVSHMIMSKDILSAAYGRYQAEELKKRHFSRYFRPIAGWLFEYYERHDRAPKKVIQKIFEKKSRKLNKEARGIIEEYLDRLATDYKKVDTSYICNEILPNFIKSKEIDYRVNKIQTKIETGDIEDAENLITSYTKLNEEEDDDTFDTFIPLTEEDVNESQSDTKSLTPAFTFEGDLNRLIGPLEKSWLVAITGIEKSGKSYLLGEIAYQAIHDKKKVLVINLELNKKMQRGRIHRRISQTADHFNSGRVIYPILDCENNQFGTCKIRQRMPNRGPLFRNSTEIVDYLKRRKWKICTKCRDTDARRNASKHKRFIPAIWFNRTKLRETTPKKVLRAIEEQKEMRLKNLRIKCFPRYSKTFDETYDYIRRYIDKNNWEPHIIMWDYLDILAPENNKMDERISIDRKWKKASKLAAELDCLVITPDQATKASRTQRSLDQMATSESKTKDGHLDVRIAINQTNKEKELGIIRISVLFHRHTGFNLNNEVIVTQRLETSEALMDNAFWYRRDNNYRIEVPNRKEW